MAHKFFNEFSKDNTVAFWITISIGIALFICLVLVFYNYTIISF